MIKGIKMLIPIKGSTSGSMGVHPPLEFAGR